MSPTALSAVRDRLIPDPHTADCPGCYRYRQKALALLEALDLLELDLERLRRERAEFAARIAYREELRQENITP
jgi:hypothetical protein